MIHDSLLCSIAMPFFDFTKSVSACIRTLLPNARFHVQIPLYDPRHQASSSNTNARHHSSHIMLAGKWSDFSSVIWNEDTYGAASTEAVQPTASESENRSPHTMAISRDRSTGTFSTKAFAVEESHIALSRPPNI
jgi:hypothetical protein